MQVTTGGGGGWVAGSGRQDRGYRSRTDGNTGTVTSSPSMTLTYTQTLRDFFLHLFKELLIYNYSFHGCFL